ncbi:flagellar basal body rod protein FlgC [Candidatus Sumerlaeota bacterium]|nr:flagellar basal body rod protein FlgC [Candidatus Sumerlaeota bacterium]
MSTFQAMDIAASGLSVQRTRMALVASNLANVQSTRDPELNGPYRRRELVVHAIAPTDFAELLRTELGGPNAEEIASAMRQAEVARISIDESPPLEVYDPSHPDANAQGIVSLPNISVMREMADMMAAARAYEANLATLRTTRNMAQGAMEIGRG